MVKFLQKQKVRYFHVIVDTQHKDKHFALISEFLDRGILNPRGGAGGPYKNEGTGFGNDGYYELIFMLDESVVEEYMKRMAEK